jgi:hypothetical protein
MRRVVISQPFFLPWLGMFEQIKHADAYAHCCEVQYSKGSFVNRVQIKKNWAGSKWLTVPLKDPGFKLIKDLVVDDSSNWRKKHIKTFELAYARAPFAGEAFDLVHEIYAQKTTWIAEFNIYAIERLAHYLQLYPEFSCTTNFEIGLSSSEQALAYIKRMGGEIYITGHGAKNYMDHELFEREGVRIEYIDYLREPYPQMHGEFDPHVTVIDLIANVGKDAFKYVKSPTRYWREFLASENSTASDSVTDRSGTE